MGNKTEEKEEKQRENVDPPFCPFSTCLFCIALTSVLLLVEFVVIVDPPELSPAPTLKSGAEDVGLSPHALSLPLSPTVLSRSPYFGSLPVPPLLWNLLRGLRLTRLQRRHHIRLIMGMLADPRETRAIIQEVSKGVPEQILNVTHNKSEIESRVHVMIDKFADRGLRYLTLAY
ncbi:ATPase 4, plasma membrane-type [Vitis vinifera]|uniref:ATPase 4, plasma membrane-type n=1 Tax=Vitis vinifera TaxID=29760 RepID=A0A438K4R4_VITVI|nr:ATPase 4, plasma membrane-type [Vitis vinifera]